MGSFRVALFFTRTFSSKEPSPPPAVKSAFAQYASGGDLMTPEQLRQFLVEFQCEPNASVADAKSLIDQICTPGDGAEAALTIEQFYQLLFSVELNPPINNQVHHDMTAPISQYYIYTGHNSYLTGNQLSSDSSEVPIIKALQRGVRAIELDMWPNSEEDDIDILHGRTLTSPVKLLQCLRSIKRYAFEASPYPVVITLEDHLTPDLQSKAAQMITETFGDMLYYPKSESIQAYPSPESLKHRILISTKPPKESSDPKEGDSKIPITKKSGDKNQSEVNGKDVDTTSQMDAPPEYKRIIAITAGKPKEGMQESLEVDPDRVRRLSLSEVQLLKAISSYGTDVIRFTQRNILGIYPKATRFTSANYNPFNGWMHGAQMVAFNMQGYGRYLWLMHGFFKANGGCGYVKKPDFLKSPEEEVFNLKVLPVKINLKVTLYMSDGWRLDFEQTHFDQHSPPDFYAEVGITGLPADTIMKKTKIIYDEWTPIWNEEFVFPLTAPEIALLSIEVRDYDMSDDDFGGQTCLPVSELRTGIRSVPLCDRKGENYKSVKLLMRFEFS